jgi:hypothetical protein
VPVKRSGSGCRDAEKHQRPQDGSEDSSVSG